MAASTNSTLDTRLTALEDEVAHLRAQVQSLGQARKRQSTLSPAAEQVAKTLLDKNDRLVQDLSRRAQTENRLRD
ncbi:hypothetical protein IWQ62_001627, partial [Dispira parvispora]